MTLVDIPTPWNDVEIEKLVDEAIASGRTKIRRSSMQIGEYNGFSRELRLEADRKIKSALELRLIPPATQCCICGKQEGRIDYHAEDYSRPLKVAPICQSCHMALHNRKRSPGYARSWEQRVKQQYGDGTKWFEFLD